MIWLVPKLGQLASSLNAMQHYRIFRIDIIDGRELLLNTVKGAFCLDAGAEDWQLRGFCSSLPTGFTGEQQRRRRI
jgi:hypothetical protein